MPFLGAESFFAELDEQMILSIKGAPGAGKTFMAFELAEYYAKKGYRILSNVKSVWNDAIKDGIEHSVIIIDEGGRYLRQWKYFGDLFAFPRKFDCYILIPSRKIPHEDLAQFLIKPFIPLRKVIGIPATVWKYRFDDGDEISAGYFSHTFATDRFGVYDTYDLSEEPKSLIEAFTKAIEDRQEQYGRDRLSGMAQFGDADEKSTLLVERIQAATRDFAALQKTRKR